MKNESAFSVFVIGFPFLSPFLRLLPEHFHAQVLPLRPLDVRALRGLQDRILLVDHVVRLREDLVRKVRVLVEVKVEAESSLGLVILLLLLVVVVLLLLLLLVDGEVLQRRARDVVEELERRLVLLRDLLLEDLVVPKRAEPEIGNPDGRLLGLVVVLPRGGVHVLRALDDPRALDVQRRVQIPVLRLERALFVQILLVQLVVRLLERGERVHARAHFVVQALDEPRAHADEVVELVLKRVHQAGVALELRERLRDLGLVHVGRELRRRARRREGGREASGDARAGSGSTTTTRARDRAIARSCV